VNVSLLVIALIIAFKIYNKQVTNIGLLNQQKNAEMEKNKVLLKLGELGVKVKAYKEYINSKDLSSSINTISELARDSTVEITSIRPAGEEDHGIYIKYPYDLKVASDSYHNIGNFISKLENHPSVFLVESAGITPGAGQDESQPEKVSVDLRISTIWLKNK
jgi:Tfp pilus assembly protein PilO